MIDRRWVQAGGGAGVLSFVLVALSFVVNSPNAPDSNAGIKVITTYLTANRDAMLTADVLVVAAAAVIIWYGATLARLLHECDDRTPLGTILLGVATAMAVFFTWDGLSLTLLAFLSKQPAGLADTSAVRAFYDLYNGVVMPGGFGFLAAIYLTVIGIAMVRRTFAAPWLGYLSLIFAPLSVVGAVLGLTLTDGGTVSPLSFAPAIGSMVVVVISSIFMLRYLPPVAG